MHDGSTESYAENVKREMFVDIANAISKYSYGPLTAVCRDVGPYRFVVVEPYNYYLYEYKNEIHLLLPKTLESSVTACPGKYMNRAVTMAQRFTKTRNEPICTTITFSMIHRIVYNNEINYDKIVLSRKFQHSTIEEILNLCISNGVFSL